MDSTKDLIIYGTEVGFASHYDINVFDESKPLQLFAFDLDDKALKTSQCTLINLLKDAIESSPRLFSG
ncbi:MAG: hypothetical protein EOP04_14770 [Proteobacteria bacterium]|nr:MAG: hypothetical protein EOP04_14770 [Pseudomonadota bacterium]